MNRKLFSILTALMWLALPLIALRYWMVWDQLPARMATHFGINGEPNGWMAREVSFYFALGLTAFMLVTFTAVCYAVQKRRAFDASASLLLGFFYVVLGFIFYANNSVIAHNLTGRPLTAGAFLLGVPVAVIVFMLLFLGVERGSALPPGPAVAEETHGSRPWAVIFLMFAGLEIAIFGAIPSTGVRVGMGLMCLLFLVIAAHTWTGFEYRFTASGVEISTLGFRLRSIPVRDIRQYRIENWNPLRGYGVRGVGNTRAYVWGNRVVHVTTQHGEVFLGHNDPARLVRDLDQLKQYTQS